MREILFRGKRVDNGEWETGSLLVERMNTSDQQEMIADKMTGYPTLVLPETVGQYTGLTDKNGKKIYEGDILEGDLEDSLDPGAKWRSEVIWGKFGWNCKDNKISLPMDGYDILEGEVVGNIHDNSELLKGDAENE